TELQGQGVIQRVEWRDQDGVPDFLIEVRGSKLQMECKNVRSGSEVFRDGYKVELQKTREQIGGGPIRGYRADEYDILAACLFNQTGEWKYLYSSTAKLPRRPKHPDYLVVKPKVPFQAQGHWHERLEDAIADILGT